MTQIIKDSCFGLIANKKAPGFSLLDIGAGTGHVLKKLMSPSVNFVPHRYVAFEPDEDALVDLDEMLKYINYMMYTKDLQVSLRHLILLSHVLYGFTRRQTEELFEHCLNFVAPGGVLLIFHHSGSKKLDILSNFMVEKQIMFHQQDYSVPS